MVVDELTATESKTKAAVELLKRLGADGKALLIDVQPNEKLGIAVRNLAAMRVSCRVAASTSTTSWARDVVADQGGREKTGGAVKL